MRYYSTLCCVLVYFLAVGIVKNLVARAKLKLRLTSRRAAGEFWEIFNNSIG